MPFLMLVAAIASGTPRALLALPLLYGLQVVRIAARSARPGRIRWIAAAMLLLAKLPEAIGACRYFIAGRDHAVPEYKSNG